MKRDQTGAEPGLEPCPFCGGKSYFISQEIEWLNGRGCDTGWKVECHACTARTGLHPTKLDAANAWNRRSAGGEVPPGELSKMKASSYLLPDPGGEVVRDLISRLSHSQIQHNTFRAGVEKVRDAIREGSAIVRTEMAETADALTALLDGAGTEAG